MPFNRSVPLPILLVLSSLVLAPAPSHAKTYPVSMAASFESFEQELNRLVESFGKRLAELKQPGYAEAQLRDDFLNPFFRALGCGVNHHTS